MQFELPRNKRILIKTYCFESGLYYLSESLIKVLRSLGNEIVIFPKAKYIKAKNGFKRTYNYSKSLEFDSSVVIINDSGSIGLELMKAINQYKIDLVISFETLMETASWIADVKKSGVKIIDIPMIEWVSPKIFIGKKYQVFDEIWCLTEYTYHAFNSVGYNNLKRVTWNFVNTKLFYNSDGIRESGVVNFYHQASLNPEHSSKNTDKVIEAFNSFISHDDRSANLYITGLVSKELLNIVNKKDRIKFEKTVSSRNDIAELYKKIDCVVAPSSQEGLGLSLYEAKACGCKVITTDFPPMNEVGAEYLCQVENIIKTGKLIPEAKISTESIYKQIKKAHEEIYGYKNNN